jgi:hypothetical protein
MELVSYMPHPPFFFPSARARHEFRCFSYKLMSVEWLCNTVPTSLCDIPILSLGSGDTNCHIWLRACLDGRPIRWVYQQTILLVMTFQINEHTRHPSCTTPHVLCHSFGRCLLSFHTYSLPNFPCFSSVVVVSYCTEKERHTFGAVECLV